MIDQDDMPGASPDVIRLAMLMSEESEEVYYAGWIDGAEHIFWEDVISESNSQFANSARRLACCVGGWIYWHDTGLREAGHPVLAYGGPRFMPMAEWLERHALWIKNEQSLRSGFHNFENYEIGEQR